MLMFSDKSGDSVIIEGDEFLRKKGSFQVVTNFYQSRQENDRTMCPRFDLAVGMLEKSQEVSLALCRRVLAATAQEGGAPTQYSNVFDLKQGLVYLYHFHNFEEVVVFDLAKELEKGERVLEIAGLFPRTFAYRSYLEKREREQAEEIARRRGDPVDAEVLDGYVGRYAIEIPGVSGDRPHRPSRRGEAPGLGGRGVDPTRGRGDRVDPGVEDELLPRRKQRHDVDSLRAGEGDAKDRIVITPPLGGPVRGVRID